MNKAKGGKKTINKIKVSIMLTLIVCLAIFAVALNKDELENIYKNIQEMQRRDSNLLAVAESDMTEINLTTLATGEVLSHNCSDYYVTKYDGNKHWDECTVCSKRYDEQPHQFGSVLWTMGESCSSANKGIYSCSCGYSYQIDNNRSHATTQLAANEVYHVQVCSKCKAEIASTRENHHDASGNLLGCSTRTHRNMYSM